MTRTLPSAAALIGGGAAFAAAASLLVLAAPVWAEWVIYIRAPGANEVVVPVGYWVAAAVWIGAAVQTLPGPAAPIVWRAVAVALVLHALLLVVAFSRYLADARAFSTPFYRLYARAFCGAALAGGAAWAAHWVRANSRRRWSAPLDLLDAPVVAGLGLLAAALVRRDPVGALAAIAIGVAVAFLIASNAPLFGSTAWRGMRAVVVDRRFVMLALFVAATALRVLYLRRVMTDPDFVATGGDGPTYDAAAWSIAQGGGVPPGLRAGYPLLILGYVYFAGAVYSLVGHSYFILCAIQSALGGAACVLLYAIAEPLFGRTVATLSAAAAAVNFLLLFSAASIGHQAVDVFLTALVVWLLARAVRRHDDSWMEWLVIGGAIAAAIAVRETNVFFFAFVVAWLPFAVAPRVHRRSAFRSMAALIAGVALLLLPLVAPMVSSADSRLRLRQHFDRLFTGQGDDVRTRKDIAGPLESPGGALAQLREQPRFVLGTLGAAVVHNFALQFFTQPYGGFDMIFLVKGSPYYYGMWFYAYVFAAAGILLCVRRAAGGDPRAPMLALLVGVIVSRTIPHLVLESHFRHRAPIEPFLILMAAVAGTALFAQSARVANAPEAAV